MIVYLDLSIIVFIFIYSLSLIYALITYQKKMNIKFIIRSIIFHVIAYLINIFLIPYFLIFAMIIYIFVYLIIQIHYFKTLLITTFFYLLNISFLLLIGGCYFTNGILYISTPYISLFSLFMPILIVIIHLILSTLFNVLKQMQFIIKCIIIIDEKKYKVKGYFDSGNMALYKNIPIVFMKGKVPSNNGEVIYLKGIKDISYKYIAHYGKIIIKKKINDVYIVFVNEKMDFNQCNVLLNKHLF